MSQYLVKGLSTATLARVYVARIAASLKAEVIYRTSKAIAIIPNTQTWVWTSALLLTYALISLPIGFRLGFVKVEVLKNSWFLITDIIAGLS